MNLVRLHTQISPDVSKPLNSINTDEREYIWRAVAAYRKEGIYTCLSPYWGVPMKFAKDSGIDGDPNQSALGLLFFDPKLQTAYKAWLKALLSETNPHTGIPLAKDPAIAVLQIQNEDSLLFWTVNAIQGPQRKNLGKLFAKFAIKKYGSLQNIATAWGDAKLPGDDFRSATLDFYNIWELTQVRTGNMGVRVADQAEFYTRTMYDFNASIVRYLREDLGCKQLVNAGNWRTADSARLNDLERYSYTAGDVDAVNRYFTGQHRGPNEGWAIMNGDKYTNASVLQDPGPFPLNIKQTIGRPMMITESSWVMPNAFASEAPLLVSAYQSLTGLGAYFWFATGDDEWTPPSSANGYTASQAKWILGTPDTLGMFPAAALAYRKGYVKRANPVVTEQRSFDDLWNRRAPLIAETDGFDPNRDSRDISPKSLVRTAIDQRAYLVGPVQVKFGSDPALSSVRPLESYVTQSGTSIRSATSEVKLDTRLQSCTVDSSSAQGVAAFFENQSEYKLSDIDFTCQNRYGSALAVAMDGKPMRASSQILVQFCSTVRPTNWQEKAAQIDIGQGKSVPGFEVTNFGTSPWQVTSPQLTIHIRNPRLRSAVALDENGNILAPVKTLRDPAGIAFRFPEKSLYVVVR